MTSSRVSDSLAGPVSYLGNRAAAERRAAYRQRWRHEGFHDGSTLADLADQAASRQAATRLRFACTSRPSTLRLHDLTARARRVAGGLAEAGVGVGDRVAVQLPNWEEAAIAYVAAAYVGAITVPIVHLYGPADTNTILEHAAPRVYLGTAAWDARGSGGALATMAGLNGVASFLVGDDLPAGARRWADLEAADPWKGPGSAEADDPAVLVYTSGTTGTPKCVVHSHASIGAELRTMPSPAREVGARVALQPWPAGHIGGLTALLGPLDHGIDTVVVDQWDTDGVLELLVEERVTTLSGVPTTLSRLLEVVEARDIELSLHITTGGAGVPPALIERCARAGWRASRCYGSSEHPSATGGRRADPLAARAETDGGALAGTEVRVLDEDGRSVPRGEAGEVQLIGPEQFLGYGDADMNDVAFTDDGWYRTGDIGVLDDAGRLTITDRIADVVNRGGEKISSVEVEDILVRHPAISEAAVVAVPHDDLGEQVCAVVMLRDGAVAPSLDDLRHHFQEARVTRQKAPEQIAVVDDLPRTPSGKVRKADLRKGLR